jgi:hypothetical protein
MRYTILISTVGRWAPEFLVRDYYSTVESFRSLEAAQARCDELNARVSA